MLLHVSHVLDSSDSSTITPEAHSPRQEERQEMEEDNVFYDNLARAKSFTNLNSKGPGSDVEEPIVSSDDPFLQALLTKQAQEAEEMRKRHEDEINSYKMKKVPKQLLAERLTQSPFMQQVGDYSEADQWRASPHQVMESDIEGYESIDTVPADIADQYSIDEVTTDGGNKYILNPPWDAKILINRGPSQVMFSNQQSPQHYRPQMYMPVNTTSRMVAPRPVSMYQQHHGPPDRHTWTTNSAQLYMQQQAAAAAASRGYIPTSAGYPHFPPQMYPSSGSETPRQYYN